MLALSRNTTGRNEPVAGCSRGSIARSLREQWLKLKPTNNSGQMETTNAIKEKVCEN